MTDPSGLDPDYQTDFNLTNLNNGNQELVSVDDTALSSTRSYTSEVVDAKGTSTATKTIQFVIPFLYGNSATILTQGNTYANLASGKLVQTKGNKAVTFNATDSYFYFGYDSSHGYLSAILDGNGFNATNAFILLDGTGTNELPTVDMLSGAENMIFYRTIVTDIVGETYTFKF